MCIFFLKRMKLPEKMRQKLHTTNRKPAFGNICFIIARRGSKKVVTLSYLFFNNLKTTIILLLQ